MTTKVQAETPAKKVRKVRVHEQRTYVKNEPDEDEAPVIDIDGDDVVADPLEEFLAGLDSERQLVLHIFVHPNYSRDGKLGTRSERSFVTSFAFTSDDVETYRQRIQFCYPQGGMFSMELRAGGAIIKKWEEQLTALPGYEAPTKNQSPFPFSHQPVINIRTPESKEPAEPLNPVSVLRDQLAMTKEMVGVMKDLIPPAPIINTNGNGEARPDERSIGDRIIEAVALKALESKDTPIDRVLEMLGGGKRESSWAETLVPVGLEIVKGLMPAINMGVQAYIRSQMQQAQVQTSPPAEGGATDGTTGQVPAALPPSPPPDPAERAWRTTVRRLLEDCFTHVEISAVSPDGMSVIPASSNIVDLLDRFQNNEQLVAMVNMLLNAEPPEVIDLCAMLQTNERDFNQVTGLKEVPAALAWLKELQEETKKALSEESDGQASES